MRKEQVQLRVAKPGNHHIAEGFVRGPKGARKGDAFWASPEAAMVYVNSGFAEPIGAALPGPQEMPQGAASQSKSSSGGPDGRSTGSRKSGARGVTGASSLSQADRVSTPSSSSTSRPGGNPEPDAT